MLRTEKLELRLSTFIVDPRMTEAMILELAWLKKWNPAVDWENKWQMRKKMGKQQEIGKAPCASDELVVGEVKAELAKVLTEGKALQLLI